MTDTQFYTARCPNCGGGCAMEVRITDDYAHANLIGSPYESHGRENVEQFVEQHTIESGQNEKRSSSTADRNSGYFGSEEPK